MSGQNRKAVRDLARMAGRAHGVVTRRQLLAAGFTKHQIDWWVQTGLLLGVYPGVYRVGHAAPSVEADYLAAVLACGNGALLAGPAAGHLLRLLKTRPPKPEVITRTERRIKGITTHRTRSLDARDAIRVNGIPVTNVPRTLVDLAATLDRDALTRACHEADVLYRTTPDNVEAILARRPASKGAATLRAILHGDIRVTLSRLERRFLELLTEAGLPLPQTNRVASARRVDCRWPDHGLTVELDSYRFHRSRHAWEQDRRREREAHARGDQIRRYTHDDVFETPAAILTELRPLLAARRPDAKGFRA
jgi:very-short-patch-repair endonuclease